MRALRAALAAAACAAAASLAFAQSAPPLAPPEGLVLDGVPPVPRALAEALAPYGDFRPHALLSWHPRKREMLVRARLHGTNQAHRVEQPGAPPQALTDLGDGVGYASYPPAGDGGYFVFTHGAAGNEVYRLYRKDLATGEVSALSAAGERVVSVAWTRDGERLAYAAQAVDAPQGHRATTTVHVVEMRKPAPDRLRPPERALARLEGSGWSGLSYSQDGRRLALVEYRSAADSRLWIMDSATGRKRRVTKADAAHPVAYAHPRFSFDGRALFATSDRGSEFKRLVRIALPAGTERVLTPKLAHDVEGFDISFDAKRIAFIDNEDGADVLRFLDLATLKELPRPPLVPGVIGGLQWRPHSEEVGFHVASARTAGDVFSYDVATNRLARWTNGNSPELNTRAFPEPDAIGWKSFDGREIRGLYYRPPARFTGKRPVLVSIHGAAESEARPGFIGRNNYLLNDLGIALIYPNVRGSSGSGKTFLRLGRRREDAVKDIGALLDWIAAQPELDARRVAVIGRSDGGYIALACAGKYAERIAAAGSIAGIANPAGLPEPIPDAERISRPLLVAQDPHGPPASASQAARIVESLKARGTPVRSILARDDGRGLAREANADFLYYATVEFLEDTLLR